MNYEINIEQFVKKDAIVVHIDTKIMAKGPNGKTEERLAITVTGNNNEQLLGVPAISNGTGKETAEGTFKKLMEFNIDDHVKAISYDTTATNSGKYSGAVVMLEKLLKRKLLHLPCRHHIFELVLEAAFSEAFQEKSTGPEIPMFKRFQKAWDDIAPRNWKPLTDKLHMTSKIKLTIKKVLDGHLKAPFVRADYRELLELLLLAIGVKLFNGRKITLKARGNS